MNEHKIIFIRMFDREKFTGNTDFNQATSQINYGTLR